MMDDAESFVVVVGFFVSFTGFDGWTVIWVMIFSWEMCGWLMGVRDLMDGCMGMGILR